MTDEQITDLWCEISQEIGPAASMKVQRLLEGMITRAEERKERELSAT